MKKNRFKKKTVAIIMAVSMLLGTAITYLVPTDAYATTWYTPEHFGFTGYGYQTDEVKSVKDKTIKYRMINFDDSDDYHEKWHKAKLTSSTVYVRGSINRFNSGKSKFMKKSTKSAFLKFYKKRPNLACGVIVKDGKVKVIAFDSYMVN